jgi:hypothetical protein
MLSADGCVEVLQQDDISCCPPPLCGNDLCCTFVAFFNLLPSGPLWDYWKQQAINYFQQSDDPAECPLVEDPQCPSLILHAIYTVLKLRSMVHGPLWVALRESSPYTAITTLDNYLARLRWEDCYNQSCRAPILGELTPLEVWTECGPQFCPPNYSLELENAVKRAVAIALTRANMGVIKNLCGINWVVEPLGALVVPVYPVPCVDPPDPPYPDQTPPPPPNENEECFDPIEVACEDCDPEKCTGMQFLITRTRDWLEGLGSGDICDTQTPLPQIPAWWEWGCDKPAGLPDKVWPGILAAECIIRSMMPPTCPSNITRAC